ncbi:MAG: ABC transporter substrate-binding protein [Rhodospirillaceae bacterium]
MIRRFPKVLLFVAVLAWGSAGAAPSMAADATAGAKKFIESLAEKAVKSLAAADIDTIERRKRFRALMLENFAFKRIAAWVLGRYWRGASETEKAEYLKLFEDMLVLVYADRFAKYSGESLSVGTSEQRGDDVLVHSEIIRPGGLKPVEVAWRVSTQEGEFKIVDVMVEGLSMGITQQKEFASVIRQNGNGVQGLLDELKKRIAANS